MGSNVSECHSGETESATATMDLMRSIGNTSCKQTYIIKTPGTQLLKSKIRVNREFTCMFLIYAQVIDCGYLLEPSMRRF